MLILISTNSGPWPLLPAWSSIRSELQVSRCFFFVPLQNWPLSGVGSLWFEPKDCVDLWKQLKVVQEDRRVIDGAQISESPSVCPTLTDPSSSPANTRPNTIKAIITHPQVHGLQFSPPRDMGIRAIRIKFPFWAQPGKFITELSGNLSPNYGTQDCYRGLPTFRTLWGFGQEKLTGDRNYLRFAACKIHLKSASKFCIWGQEFDSRKKGCLDCPEHRV